MALRLPLVNIGGDSGELPPTDTLDVNVSNTGYLAISANTTVNPKLYRTVSVTVPTLGSVTVTFDASNARAGFEFWVKRADGNSVGTLTVASTSGNVQNATTGLISGLTSFIFPATVTRIGYVWSGTVLEVISAS